MSDDDLDSLRAQRMAQLQNQFVSSLFSRKQWVIFLKLLFQGAGGDGEQQKKQQEMRQQQEDMKNTFLSQILDQGARARREYYSK